MRNDSIIRYSQLPAPSKKGVADTVKYIYNNTFVEPYRRSVQDGQLTEVQPQTFVAIADIPIQHVVLYRKTKEKVYTYTKENAPLRLSHQLTYSFDTSLTAPHQIAHSFWVDKIQVIQIGELTKVYGLFQKGQPNALYTVEKRPAPDKTIDLAIVLGAVGLTGILIRAEEDMFSGMTIGLNVFARFYRAIVAVGTT